MMTSTTAEAYTLVFSLRGEKAAEFGNFVYRKADEILLRTGNRVLSVIVYGSIIDEAYVEGLSDINIALITKGVVNDLYSLRTILSHYFWKRYRKKLSVEVFPYEVFIAFYRNCVPITVIIARKGLVIAGGELINKVLRENCVCGEPSLYYSLCRAIREYSKALLNILHGRIALSIRYLQHSLVHALRAIILRETNELPCTIPEIRENLRKLKRMELLNTFSQIIMLKIRAFNAEKIYKRKRLESLGPRNPLFKAFKDVFDVLSRAWLSVGINILTFDELIGIIKKLKPIELVMRCQDNYPIIEMYDREERYHRASLCK